MNKQSDDNFLSNIRQMLNTSVTQVDSVTQARLREARQRALQFDGDNMFVRVGGTLAGFFGMHPTLRTLALAMSVTLALLASWQLSHPDNGVRVNDEVMLLSAQDDLDLYDQLDFLEWLNTRDATKG